MKSHTPQVTPNKMYQNTNIHLLAACHIWILRKNIILPNQSFDPEIEGMSKKGDPSFHVA